MAYGDEALRTLREALTVSPDNVPLRQHLAQTLLGLGLFAEAEQEYREALSRSPTDPGVKTGLALAFYRQGKRSEALLLVEDLCKRAEAGGAAHVLYAWLLLHAGDVPNAVAQYKLGVEKDHQAAGLRQDVSGEGHGR